MNPPAHKPWLDSSKTFAERAELLLKEMTTGEKLDQLNYCNKAVPRLGMNDYVWWNEALHGLARSGAATVFPQAIAMAATFSAERVHEMARITVTEGRARHHECARKGDFGAYKGLTYWSPNVNIFRDSRWGRGHETYGEDPCLTGRLGQAFVRGIQGTHPKFVQAVATPKHYAVHSGPELTRLSFNSVTDERDLRETYLPAFKACFEAGALSVMTAYNAYNGEPCATNDYLINQILRKEWGFGGAVVTDAGAGTALYKEHKAVADYCEATAKELSRGVDVIVDWEQGAHDAYQRGLIADEDLNRAVRNQLLVKFKLGFFDDPAEVPMANTPYEVIECRQHLDAARQASRECLVLLKNQNNFLPLKKEALKSVAVIGPNADARDILLGNYHGTPTRHITLLEGIRQALPESCRVWHARGCEHLAKRTEPCAEDLDRLAEAVSVAGRSDVAILCLGLTPSIEGEAGDAFNAEAGGDRLRIELPEIQETLLQKIVATGTPVVVLMVTGSAVISQTIEQMVPAMLHCWYPGAEGGEAIAQTLFGENNPGGRLPVTFYRSTADLPDFSDYSMAQRTYRFFTGEVAYPFGFGLSYTRFAYRNLVVEKLERALRIEVAVKNTGALAGDEVVQVYASMPREFRTPVRSLVAMERIKLAAGEEQIVRLTIPQDQFLLTTPDGTQFLSPGICHLSIGGSQNDPRSIELMGREPLATSIAW